MRLNFRSISGAALMLVIIPIFAGLLACMPVPIGNPEKSRIDQDITGVWIMDGDSDTVAAYLFQPYDKRTWLLIGAEIEPGEEFVGEELEIQTAQDALIALETYPIGSNGLTSTSTVAYKVWLTKLGGEQFMTWENVGGFRDDGSFTPEYWYVFKVHKTSDKQFELLMLNSEHDTFDDIVMPKDYEGDDYARKMRRTWERAIKKAIDDDELYGDPLVLRRLPAPLMGKASELFQEVVEFE